MTVVHPNHIVGINSITVQTGDSLSVHKADGSLIRTIVSNTGVSTFHAIEVSKGGGDLNVGVSTFFVDNSAGRIGVGTDVPASLIDVVNTGGAAEIICKSSTQPRLMLKTTGTTSECRVDFGDSGDSSRGAIGYNHSDDALKFYTTGVANERLRIDSSGRLLIGHAATRAIAGGNSMLQIEKNSSELATFLRTSNDTGAPWLALAKSRSSAGAACQAGDNIGAIAFIPHDGTDLNHHAAEIRAYVDTGIGTDDTPGYLTFHTNGGASTTTERLRITSGGQVKITGGGNVSPASKGNLFVADGGTAAQTAGEGGTIAFGAWLGGDLSGPYSMAAIQGISDSGTTNANTGSLIFYTRDQSGGPDERMRITSGGAVGIGTTSPQQSSHPSIHLHSDQNDDARIAITTPNKASGRIGYYGLSNRFGIDMYNGFQIRDVADSYATRFMVISNGNTSIGTDNSNSRLTLSSGSSNNAVSIRNTTAGNGHVGILFSTQDSSTGREKVAIYHQETHGQAHYAGDLVYCMNNATGGATQVGITDERFRMKRDGRFEMKANNTSTAYDQPLLKVQLAGDSSNDKTFISLWNGNTTGDIGSETSHIDFVWQDTNTNVKPQVRISGTVGDGSDSDSQVKEGKGYLTFHCSNTSAGSGEEDPGQRLKIAHDGTFTGSSSNNISDQRLKENIATITDATTKIKGLTGRTFTWKTEADMQEGTKYGFIAQEVEPIVSDLVCDWTGIRVLDKDGQITKQLTPDKSKGDSYAKSVNVEGVIPILVEALKEALTEIDTLKTKVAALEAA